MRSFALYLIGLCAALAPAWGQGQAAPPTLHVKYAVADAAYLDAGRNAGLTEGMRLIVKRAPSVNTVAATADMPVIAELLVSAVADSSAVCDIVSSTGELHRGDLAFLTADAIRELDRQRGTTGRSYPQVVTFNGGDPLDEEARETVPKPPLPEVNRARGRIGFDYSGMNSNSGVSSSNTQVGMSLRLDYTRIAGTYWNLNGYWRGRFSLTSGGQQNTLTDLMNRTYLMSANYSNPQSPWKAGFGRLLLPWASSLDTLDGGYLAYHRGNMTTGFFAGSTPDPTSWDYSPNQRMAGVFVNFEGGSYDRLRYTSTAGFALNTIGWAANRQYLFTENGLFFKRYFSLYHSMQVDRPKTGPYSTNSPLSRSYLTLRYQPHRRIALDLSHNYFRDIPTFSTSLIATGLVDKWLFQGLSAGARVEVVKNITLYSNLGRSVNSGDPRRSLNQMYGITDANVWHTGLRLDARYSKFDGSFGRGTYRSLSMSRNFGARFRWELQGGTQTFATTSQASAFPGPTQAHYVTSTVDVLFGAHYFLQGAMTVQRGTGLSYSQWYSTIGYSFDTLRKAR